MNRLAPTQSDIKSHFIFKFKQPDQVGKLPYPSKFSVWKGFAKAYIGSEQLGDGSRYVKVSDIREKTPQDNCRETIMNSLNTLEKMHLLDIQTRYGPKGLKIKCKWLNKAEKFREKFIRAVKLKVEKALLRKLSNRQGKRKNGLGRDLIIKSSILEQTKDTIKEKSRDFLDNVAGGKSNQSNKTELRYRTKSSERKEPLWQKEKSKRAFMGNIRHIIGERTGYWDNDLAKFIGSIMKKHSSKISIREGDSILNRLREIAKDLVEYWVDCDLRNEVYKLFYSILPVNPPFKNKPKSPTKTYNNFVDEPYIRAEDGKKFYLADYDNEAEAERARSNYNRKKSDRLEEARENGESGLITDLNRSNSPEKSYNNFVDRKAKKKR